MTILCFIIGFVIGVIVTCYGTVKLLYEHSQSGEPLANNYRITYLGEYNNRQC